MRSVVAITALVLVSCVDFGAAKLCTVSTSKTKLNTPRPTSTPTPTVVENLVSNGNFGMVSPKSKIPEFQIQGDARTVVGAGYTGDDSPEKNAASLTASKVGSKRDFQPAAGVAQTLVGLQSGQEYTIQFYYAIASNAVANACTLESSFGGDVFDSRVIDAVVPPSNTDDFQWETVLKQVTVSKSAANISIRLQCESEGSADVYIDQIFISDQVTPRNIGNFVLSYETEAASGTETSSTDPTTSVYWTTTFSATLVPSTTVPATTVAATSSHVASFPQNPTLSKTSRSKDISILDVTVVPSATQPPLSAGTAVCPNGVSPPGACFVASPSPSSAQCQRLGQPLSTTYQYDIAKRPAQLNIQDCAFICQSTDDCKAIAFNADDKKAPCVFATDTISGGGFDTNAATKLLWSDIKCFQCYNCNFVAPALTSTTKALPAPSKTAIPAPVATTCPPDVYPGFCTSSSAPAPGLSCSKRGTVTAKPYQLDLDAFPEQYRPRYCAYMCQKDPKCKAFGFSWTEFPWTCLFLNVGLSDGGFEANKDAEPVWSDIGCWNCLNCPGGATTV